MGHIYTSIYYCCKSFPVLLHDVTVGGWIASYVFIFIFWSRCCCCCCVLLLLLRAAAAHSISTEAERGTAYCFFLLRLRYFYCCFLCVYTIAVAAVEKGYAFCILVEVLLLLTIFLVGCADAAAGACAAYSISTEVERGTGYCFFLLRFCLLHCDAADVYCCCCS